MGYFVMIILIDIIMIIWIFLCDVGVFDWYRGM